MSADVATNSAPPPFPPTPTGDEVSSLLPPVNMPTKDQLQSSGHPVLRASPRKSSSSTQQASRALPTPVSMSPTAGSTSSFHPPRLPPQFDNSPWSRYTAQYSPYRPGEYGRNDHYAKSGRSLASERTKIQRTLFESSEDADEDGDHLMIKKKEDTGSSPLAPAFEAKMVLRNGASVDLISWLRTNFHHIPESQHNSMTPSMSLIGIRALLLERFPRVPELSELSKAVVAAFPRSRWESSHGAFSKAEPPTIRGLFWHGKDVADEDEDEEEEDDYVPSRNREKPQPQIVTRARANGKVWDNGEASGSQSPIASALVSPISSSARKPPPATPARSVLEEFAEIATLADKTPRSKTRSLPEDGPTDRFEGAPTGALALADVCHSSFDTTKRKRRASQSPEMHRRRSSTPDKLHGLLAAAEAVEGSPLTSVLGHKRRRTIGGPAPMYELIQHPHRKSHKTLSRGTASPAGTETVFGHGFSHDIVVPLNDTASAVSLADLDTVSLHTPSRQVPGSSAPSASSSSASQSSNISSFVPGVDQPPPRPPRQGGRKPNELPTDGENPGVDCKPPHPYHEMIRYAIENAPDRRLQLSQIYSTIADRFPFFKTLDEKKTAGWQNSIRHNLSLKKMFVRVNKVDGMIDDSGGKGGWWTVEPDMPDEGRPGRKVKSKKRGGDDIAEESIAEGSTAGEDDKNWMGKGGREESLASTKSGKGPRLSVAPIPPAAR
ncbi:hypothetical protein BD324DRAFT_610999 [Kockovaella imperatae]|uniref:Fork-head domain-containing protein n=1 Tax=Kockovaella imperatae TaxID=4999 RepID=A0A1Y1URD4_9TREE|nr:hypothetical protein BD324DRAFT_610999 [Kockovaella imperatae]ORX40492.1 hypothetical protein BD324DRAFT_610999 [Kockovaella imperatae]